MVRRFVFPALCCAFLLTYVQRSDAQKSHSGEFSKQFTISSASLFRVMVDIDAAEVRLVKSPVDREARVTMYYSEHGYQASADFDEKRNRLDISLSKKSWWDASDGDGHAEVLIELPPAVEIDLDAEIKAGEIDVDLGGLGLVGLDLTTMAGQVLVDFSEPNAAAMDLLRINTKVGETELLRLGNARFKEAEINGGIGEMRVDFRGAVLSNASAHIDLDLGETRLRLPDEVGVKMAVSKFLFFSHLELPYDFEKSGRYYYSKNYDSSENELFVKVSPGMGGLRID